MRSRWLLVLFCLFFSGLAALVYQVIWTRLLGFAFGTTTEAIGTVLAVFFGGMGIGNWLAARHLARVTRPLRLYALLELAIGAFALLSLPLLWRLEWVYALVGADLGPFAAAGVRIFAAALLLLPPTIAMGATLPVVARALVASDHALGRSSAYLYTANTLGAVAGAYFCGFWLIPWLGLGASVISAALLNLGVAAAIFRLAGQVTVTAGGTNAAAPGRTEARGWYLAFFGVSGFVAIGYEIVWSKAFSLIMEGTLYGFSSVLASYLLGIALGSLAISGWVDRVRDLPRLFGALHVGIGVCVALGISVVPWIPWIMSRLAALGGGEHGLHLAFVAILPIVLAPTALFGAAFPVLIRIYTDRASAVGEGMGIAVAVNTAGSIAASLLVGFWWIPSLGSDATLYLLLLIDLAVGFLVLLRFQQSVGRERIAGLATAATLVLAVAVTYNGVHLDRALAGRWVKTPNPVTYKKALDRHLANTRAAVEGRHALVSVHDEEWGRRIRSNGLPESGRSFTQPYNAPEVDLLGILPYLLAEDPKRGLVIGFGGGGTVDAMVHTDLAEIEVVELEQRVVDLARELYPDTPMPLDDPRVALRINDGRHHLLLGRHRGGDGYDVIASQPSHPWLAGAANLFTEEFFELVRDNLNRGGVFALWLNGFRIDAQSALAVMTSFERVFPGGQLVAAGGPDLPWQSLILLGGHDPILWNGERIAPRLAEVELSETLGHHSFKRPEDLLAQFEGALASFAAIAPERSNTDDNAFLETRIPRLPPLGTLDPNTVLTDLAPDTPTLPPLEGEIDGSYLVDRMLSLAKGVTPWPTLSRARRLLAAHGDILGPALRLREAEVDLRDPATEAAAEEALRALTKEGDFARAAHRVLGLYFATQKKDFSSAITHFEAAYAQGAATRDAYDAARAWHRVDREKAWQWAARIPDAERNQYPRLALYEAEQALAENASDDRLRSAFAGLLAYRDSNEGRTFAGVNATAAELALRLGDPLAARAFWDSDRRAREIGAQPVRRKLIQSLSRGEIGEAQQMLDQLHRLVPSDLATLRWEAELARARGDEKAFELALKKVEHWAIDARQGAMEARRIRLSGPAKEPEDAPEVPSSAPGDPRS